MCKEWKRNNLKLYTIVVCSHRLFNIGNSYSTNYQKYIQWLTLSHPLQKLNLQHSVFMTQKHSLDGNSRRKHPNFQKSCFSWLPWHIFFHFSSPSSACSSFWSSFAGCPSSSLAMPGVPLVPLLWRVPLQETHARTGEPRLQPDAWVWSSHFPLNSYVT